MLLDRSGGIAFCICKQVEMHVFAVGHVKRSICSVQLFWGSAASASLFV